MASATATAAILKEIALLGEARFWTRLRLRLDARLVLAMSALDFFLVTATVCPYDRRGRIKSEEKHKGHGNWNGNDSLLLSYDT
jgi:hypothetical protein